MKPKKGGRPDTGALALHLFDELFPAPSWAAWKAAVAAILGLPVTDAQADLIRRCTERERTPTQLAREVWIICGRRAGKSQVAALLAVYLACFRTYRRSPGERLVGMLLAADRRQGRVLKDYIGGLLRALPELERLIARELAESIELTNGITIEIHTSSFKSTRGYTCIFIICDEVAFWFADDSANPAAEVLRALRPSLTTTGGPLICLTTPYAAEGPPYDAVQRHFGRADDPVLVWMASTDVMNTTVDPAIIEAAYLEDPEAAASEYGRDGLIGFRSDLRTLLPVDVLNACVMPGRRELPPQPGVVYMPFADPSGGSSDAFGLALAHKDHSGLVLLDVLREWRAPFDPAVVVRECSDLLRRYHCVTVTGDKYAAEWVVSAFKQHGIDYRHSELTKSELFLELLPLVNASQVQLLDNARVLSQLAGLQRRTGRSGRDTIDHRSGQHDDVANAAAGALVLATRSTGRLMLPADFRACNRELSGLPLLSGGCYLYGGVGRPPGDEICGNCVGNAFVRAARAAQQGRTGEAVDIIEFYRGFIQVPEWLAWQLFREESNRWADGMGI